MQDDADLLLRVTDLRTWFFTDAGVVRAVDGVSFTLHRGETLGIVGEIRFGQERSRKVDHEPAGGTGAHRRRFH